jgi:hypothetical protein
VQEKGNRPLLLHGYVVIFLLGQRQHPQLTTVETAVSGMLPVCFVQGCSRSVPVSRSPLPPDLLESWG